MSDHDRPPTVAVVTLGCGRNEVDSENVVGLLSASGFQMVADPERADAVIVNTCAFISAAKRESIDTILAAADLKEQGRASAVFVTGCLAERYTSELREELPEADAIVPFADYGRLPDLLRSRLGNGSAPRVPPAAFAPDGSRPMVPPFTAAPPVVPSLVPAGRRALPLVFPAPAGQPFAPRPLPGGPVALVKLAEGCDRDCSFCAIPSFRGRFRSRRPTEVLDEVAWLARHGVSEIGLVAENSTSYGKDLGGREALIGLLRDLAGIDGLRRVRLNYLQPDEITPGLLEEMAANPVVCSYFDLSLQHVSEPVLRRMRRGGSAVAFLRLIERIRSLDPDAAFRSNFILGFPGERQADVHRLEEFLEAARLDWVAFFAYSPEDGTAALELDRRVASRTARARVERAQELQDRVLAEVQAAWVGRRLDVLVERVDGAGTAEGRSFREGIDSDGIVRVEQAAARPGDYLEVEVIAAEGPELLARPFAV
ncbi:MAG TPA: MiaB/RimO family radical SAM methylthiotransferase [Actinomycetes bacterium]|nr:MiaB/RimO family radical SAM methylthiotransferase [Actinomycetes bacterium]